MRRMHALLLPLAAAGCIWLPLGSDAIPRVELDEVYRSTGDGVEWTALATAEPDGRGVFFEDSLIAFRTRATGEGVHFRLWNRRDEVMRVEWGPVAVGKPETRCPAAAVSWEMRWRGGGPPADVVPARGSREDEAVAVARVPTLQGGTWTSVPLGCVAGGAAEGRVPLRLAVEVEGRRYLYTFWYAAAGGYAGGAAAAGGQTPLRR